MGCSRASSRSNPGLVTVRCYVINSSLILIGHVSLRSKALVWFEWWKSLCRRAACWQRPDNVFPVYRCPAPRMPFAPYFTEPWKRKTVNGHDQLDLNVLNVSLPWPVEKQRNSSQINRVLKIGSNFCKKQDYHEESYRIFITRTLAVWRSTRHTRPSPLVPRIVVTNFGLRNSQVAWWRKLSDDSESGYLSEILCWRMKLRHISITAVLKVGWRWSAANRQCNICEIFRACVPSVIVWPGVQ